MLNPRDKPIHRMVVIVYGTISAHAMMNIMYLRYIHLLFMFIARRSILSLTMVCFSSMLFSACICDCSSSCLFTFSIFIVFCCYTLSFSGYRDAVCLFCRRCFLFFGVSVVPFSGDSSAVAVCLRCQSDMRFSCSLILNSRTDTFLALIPTMSAISS